MASHCSLDEVSPLWHLSAKLTDDLTSSDYHHQLSLILDVLGTPVMEDFYEITSARSK